MRYRPFLPHRNMHFQMDHRLVYMISAKYLFVSGSWYAVQLFPFFFVFIRHLTSIHDLHAVSLRLFSIARFFINSSDGHLSIILPLISNPTALSSDATEGSHRIQANSGSHVSYHEYCRGTCFLHGNVRRLPVPLHIFLPSL